jgi:Rrf2 family protein
LPYAVLVKPNQANQSRRRSVWVSRRTDYATRAILALALEGGGPLKLEELARRTAVPQSVLEQVMPTMRTAGIVRSERGPAGGYRLNKSPEEITLERIIRLFQGQLAPIGCATRHNPEPCPMTVGCTLRDVWEEIRDATILLLGRVTFADLAARAGGPWIDPSLLVVAAPETAS